MDKEEQNIIQLLTSESKSNVFLALELLKSNPILLSEKVKDVLVFLHYRGEGELKGSPELNVSKSIEQLNITSNWHLDLCQYFYATEWIQNYLGNLGTGYQTIRGTRNELIKQNVFFSYFITTAVFPELLTAKMNGQKEYLNCLHQAIFEKLFLNNVFWRLDQVKDNYPSFLNTLNRWKLDSMPSYLMRPAHLLENFNRKKKFEALLFDHTKTVKALLAIAIRPSYWLTIVNEHYFFDSLIKRIKTLVPNQQLLVSERLEAEIKTLETQLKALKKKKHRLDLEKDTKKGEKLMSEMRKKELELQQFQKLLINVK